jgi:uncharacterized protein YodC (DUF2158 family)
MNTFDEIRLRLKIEKEMSVGTPYNLNNLTLDEKLAEARIRLKDRIDRINKIKMEKMEKKIEVGSVVSLKSGGPKMTVTDIQKLNDEENKFTCIFFYKGELNEYTFDKSTLQLIN